MTKRFLPVFLEDINDSEIPEALYGVCPVTKLYVNDPEGWGAEKLAKSIMSYSITA